MTYPNIDNWERTRENKEDAWVYSDGKNFIINLEKVMPSIKRMTEPDRAKVEVLKTFVIERTLFYKKTDLIAQYMDYFIEFFDEDKELPLALSSLKKAVDSSRKNMTQIEFIKLLMMRFFKDTNIKRNIYKLVEANYNLDVTVDSKTGRAFTGIYDFTNDEAKILLAVSAFMKFIIPITSQYIVTNSIYSDKELSGLIIDVFVESVYRMGNHYGVDVDDLLVKLYDFTNKKILKHYGLHQVLWNQQCALRGLTESMHVDTILIKHLLGNNMFKFKFDENIVSFLKSIVETQLICTINKSKYKANPVRIDNTKDYNGLSGADKLMQSMNKMDESSVIRCVKSIESEFTWLKKNYGEISDDEHVYYYENFLTTSMFHKMLVDYFFADHFGGFTEQKSVTSDQYVDMMIWCKRILIQRGYVQLPLLISSNMQGRMSQRVLQNTRFVSMLESSETHQKLMNNTYRCLKGYKDKIILELISNVLNNVFTYVEYDDQDKTGKTIEFNEAVIGDELLNFVDNI